MTSVEAPPARAARRRPPGVTALAWFFVFGVAMSGLSAVSLLTPGGWLEPMWRLNPRAHGAFAQMGAAAPVMLGVVCAACGACAYGFFTARRWGYVLAVIGLSVQLLASVANAVFGPEPRAWLGVPIVALILWYLFRGHVRAYFRSGEGALKAP